MTTPAFPDLAGVLPGYGPQDPNPWGLGVEVRGEQGPALDRAGQQRATWGHFGRAGTFLWWDPEAHVGLVVSPTGSSVRGPIEAWPALSSAVLAEHG